MACRECGRVIPPEVRDAGVRKSLVCSVECRLARKKKTEKAWTERHRATVNAYQSEYRKNYRDANPEYFREYYQENKDRRKSEARGWYSANVERATAAVKAYREARPDWRRALGRKSRATRRARELEAMVEAIDHRIVFERDKGLCGICNVPIDTSRWEVDHIVPLSKGGRHSYDNVQLAHRRCNRAKGAKVVSECSLSP